MRYCYTFALMLLLTACTADDTVPTSAGGRGAVCFDTYVPTPAVSATRVAAAYDADGGIPSGGSIGVYAYYHDNSTWAADWAAEPRRTRPNFMLNQQATNATPGSFYTYAPVKYWPNDGGDKVSFVAYYPYTNAANAAATGITPQLAEDAAALPSYAFTVQTATSDQVDFLVSTLLSDLPNGTVAVMPSQAADRSQLTTTDRVRFRLYHATSKVIVSVVVSDELRERLVSFTASNIRIAGLHDSGTLAYTDGNTFAWSAQTGSQTYAFERGVPQLLLPQTLADGVRLTMDYSLTFNTDGTVYRYDGSGQPVAIDQYTYTTTGASVQLNSVPAGAPITEWLPNHVYHYIIRLGADSIEFTGQVAEWGEYIWVPL